MRRALRFHPSDEITLVKVQKMILSWLNRKSVVAYPFFPIFCPLDFCRTSDGICHEGVWDSDPALETLSLEKQSFSEDFKYSGEKIFLDVPTAMEDGMYVPLFFMDGEVETFRFFVKIAVLKNGSFVSDDDFSAAVDALLLKMDFPLELKRARLLDFEKSGFATRFYREKWIKV